jgi:heme-degrading monooxygenase HmoA
MTAYNVVRFRVKPGREKEFVDLNREMGGTRMPGFRKGALVKTGERTYCLVGEWDNFDAIVASRPEMIASLDGMRDLLEDLGGGLGVTDPVSGETVLEM